MDKEQISFWLDTQLLERLDTIANKEKRTRTNMIAFILINYLEKEN